MLRVRHSKQLKYVSPHRSGQERPKVPPPPETIDGCTTVLLRRTWYCAYSSTILVHVNMVINSSLLRVLMYKPSYVYLVLSQRCTQHNSFSDEGGMSKEPVSTLKSSHILHIHSPPISLESIQKDDIYNT